MWLNHDRGKILWHDRGKILCPRLWLNQSKKILAKHRKKISKQAGRSQKREKKADQMEWEAKSAHHGGTETGREIEREREREKSSSSLNKNEFSLAPFG